MLIDAPWLSDWSGTSVHSKRILFLHKRQKNTVWILFLTRKKCSKQKEKQKKTKQKPWYAKTMLFPVIICIYNTYSSIRQGQPLYSYWVLYRLIKKTQMSNKDIGIHRRSPLSKK